MQGTLRWDADYIHGVKLNAASITASESNFALNDWTSGTHTLTVTTPLETRTWEPVFTTLPLVVIDISQKELWSLRQETNSDTKHPSYVTFIDPRFRTDGQAEFGSKVMMRVRGVTSAGKPQKSFALKLVDNDGGSGIASLDKFEMTGGEVALACFDDPMSAESSIEINGGTLFSSSLVDDGMDCKGSIEVNGGKVYVVGSYPNEGAFDNNGKTFASNGGTIIGIGAKSDSPMSSKSDQAYIVLKKPKA